VTAILSSPEDPSGETLEVDGGIFENNTVHFEMPTEVGQVMIDGVIDAPDSMSVSISLAGFGGVDFVMSRIEIAQPGDFKPKKKKAKADEGPPAPDINHSLEGGRALFEGRAVAVVSVARIDEAESVLATFAKHNLPVSLIGIRYDDELAELLNKYDAGILLSANSVTGSGYENSSMLARINADGVATALYSNSQSGSAGMPQALSLATSYGLGAEQALASLTSQAADVLGLSDRVGRIQPGLDADIVVFSGVPFDLRSKVTTVFVNGNEVPQQ
jgi:hypothetical protein